MQVCNNLVTDEIDDQKKQSDYKFKIELQNPEGENSTLSIASAWWKRATRRTTPKTTWPPRPSTFHTAHMNLNSWMKHARRPIDRFRSSWLHTTSWLKFHLCASSHVIHAWSACLFSFRSSIQFYFLNFPFLFYLLHFFPKPWGT